MMRTLVPVVMLAFLGCSTTRHVAPDGASLPKNAAAESAVETSAAESAVETSADGADKISAESADETAAESADKISADSADETAADSAAIHAQSRAFSDAYERGDLDAMMEIYTEDAVIFPGNMEMVKGLEDLRGYWQLGPGQRVTHHQATPTAIHVEGDMASDYGIYEVSGIRGGEAWGPFRGKYLIVWRREADGQWRMKLDMWNARSREAQPTIECLGADGTRQASADRTTQPAADATPQAAANETQPAANETIHVACVSEVDLSKHFEGMEGTFVVYDVQKGTTRVHDRQRARERFIPASTFKIPNSLIALESGAASGSDFTIAWDSSAAPPQDWWPSSWRKDQTLQSALRNSVVWYYQELARRMGEDTIQRWLDRFDYGNRDIGESIDRFWLRGPLTISPFEQVAFLDRFYHNKLGLSDRTTAIVKEMLVLEEAEAFVLSGKTGTLDVTPTTALAWLVGYLEVDEGTFIFALNMEGGRVWEDWPPQKRLELVKDLLGELGVIPGE